MGGEMSDNAGDKPENGQNGQGREGSEGSEEEVIFPEDEATEADEEPTELEKAHAERDRMREQLLRVLPVLGLVPSVVAHFSAHVPL